MSEAPDTGAGAPQSAAAKLANARAKMSCMIKGVTKGRLRWNKICDLIFTKALLDRQQELPRQSQNTDGQDK
ncbi:hypothetical protein B4Q13_22215, partial [Lacticaseibacillus rhamnosus]